MKSVENVHYEEVKNHRNKTSNAHKECSFDRGRRVEGVFICVTVDRKHLDFVFDEMKQIQIVSRLSIVIRQLIQSWKGAEIRSRIRFQNTNHQCLDKITEEQGGEA